MAYTERTHRAADKVTWSMIGTGTDPGTHAVYPFLAIGASLDTRYAKAWRIPTLRIGLVAPTTPCSTPSFVSTRSPSCEKSRTALTGTVWLALSSTSSTSSSPAEGFARLRCPECAFERLAPFSCKHRSFVPAVGGGGWRSTRPPSSHGNEATSASGDSELIVIRVLSRLLLSTIWWNPLNTGIQSRNRT